MSAGLIPGLSRGPERGCLLETLIKITLTVGLIGFLTTLVLNIIVIVWILRGGTRGLDEVREERAQTVHKPNAPPSKMTTQLLKPEETVDANMFSDVEATDFGKEET